MTVTKNIGNNTFISLPSEGGGKKSYNVNQIKLVVLDESCNTTIEKVDPETDEITYPIHYHTLYINYGEEWDGFVIEGENFIRETEGYKRTYSRPVLPLEAFLELSELFGLAY